MRVERRHHTTDCCADCDWLGDIARGGDDFELVNNADWGTGELEAGPWFWSGIQCWRALGLELDFEV